MYLNLQYTLFGPTLNARRNGRTGIGVREGVEEAIDNNNKDIDASKKCITFVFLVNKCDEELVLYVDVVASRPDTVYHC